MHTKKLSLIALVLIGLLVSCSHPVSAPSQNPDLPENKTFIVFDNSQGICAAAVYSDYRRREIDKIAEIPIGQLSGKVSWTPGTSVPFYFSYSVKLKGIDGFFLNYVPEIGKDQIAVRIDADTTTNISVPKLDETLSSPDTLLSNSSYLLIQNNSSYSFELHRGTSSVRPDNAASSAVVNAGERPQYTINPGSASNYRLLVGADYIAFSSSLVFEAGRVYSFVFDGDVTLVRETEVILGNVAGSSGSIPQTPGAPVVITSDSLITLYWTAAEGAETYEVYLNTAQEPPDVPVKTVPGTVTILTDITNKTVYYLWIKAINEAGSSAYSPRSRAIPWPDNEVPAVPGIPVIIPGVKQLTVNWEECGGATSYEVYINTSPITPPLPEITSDTTSAVIGNLEEGKIYYLWVRAVNSAGKSDYSPFEAGTPRIPTVAPAAPGRPVVTAGSRELFVSWQAVELAEAYEVWFGTSGISGEALKYSGDISGDKTEALITGLVNETTYYVWLKAKNNIGVSNFSLPVSATPSAFSALPETPAVPTVIPGSRELIISWPPAEGAVTYELWSGETDNPASAEKYGADVLGTSVSLTNLVNEITYYFWVRAKNSIGTSGFSAYADGTPSAFTVPPPAPETAPFVSAGNGQLALSWQEVEGASAYEIWAGSIDSSEAATKQGDDVSDLSAVITGLENNVIYYVRIKAKNSIGTSDYSPMASGTPSAFAGPPQAPAVPAVVISNGQTNISWTAIEGATAYEVWLATIDDSASALQQGEEISTSLSTVISGLSSGTTYYIWLKATNSHGTSGFSPAASVKPIASAPSPSLTAGNSQISVSWTAIAGADQYEVFCGTGVNPPQTASQTVNAPAASTTITGLVNGTTYNVWIWGKNSSGTGGISSPASVKPIGNMGAVTVSAGNQRLSLSWASVAGADQYEVYYNTTNSIPASPAQTVSTTTATINGLVNGTTYYAWIKAKNSRGTSSASTAATGRPLGTPGAPVVTPGFRQLTVTWTAAAGAAYYEVYCGIGSYSTTLAATTTGTTATITGLTGGTSYYIRLLAKNYYNGISDYGPSVIGTPDIIPGLGLYRGNEKIGDQNLDTALSWISTNVVNGDEYYIVLGADESVPPMTLDYSSKNVAITLMGYGSEKTVSLNSNGKMFYIGYGVTFTLDENIALVGRSTNNVMLVDVDSYSKFIMNGGTISGNNNGPSLGPFPSGGGVYVGQSGTFIMNGGTISGNSASLGGGVFVDYDSNFTMNGGVISGNTASSSSYSSYGGGVYVDALYGSFTMNGGTISGNTCIAPNNSYGGGVYVKTGTFTMNGGKISGNTANYGGGVYTNTVPNSTFKKLPPSGGIQNSGIIYGYEAAGTENGVPLKNSADNDSSGHAVYVPTNYASSIRMRNITAGQTDQIDTSTGKGLSANGNPPYGQ